MVSVSVFLQLYSKCFNIFSRADGLDLFKFVKVLLRSIYYFPQLRHLALLISNQLLLLFFSRLSITAPPRHEDSTTDRETETTAQVQPMLASCYRGSPCMQEPKTKKSRDTALRALTVLLAQKKDCDRRPLYLAENSVLRMLGVVVLSNLLTPPSWSTSSNTRDPAGTRP